MGAEAAAAAGPMSAWGTWEELILGGAVLRHGTRDWSVVASELRARALHPHSFTPEVCKAKFEDLQKRYAGSTKCLRAWFEELRKQRVAELKRELARSEDSIGSLELKIKSLEAERHNSNQTGYDLPQTESPQPVLNSDGTESVCKEVSKDENSAGSFTKDTRMMTNRLRERHNQEREIDTKPDVSVFSEQGKELSLEKLAEAARCGQGVTVRKPRGQRKRKSCHQAVKEGSVGECDNVGSCNGMVTAKRKDCNAAVIWEGGNIGTSSGVSPAKRKDCYQVVKRESDDVRSSNGSPTAKRKNCNHATKETSVGESGNFRPSKGVLIKKKKDLNQVVRTESDSIRSSNDVHTAKRKDCNQAVEEGSGEESDIVGSSNGASTTQKRTSTSESDQITRNSGNGRIASTAKGHNVMDIFQSIASSEPATVFRHRMDSQKRARYRKVIKQHLDMGTVRSRIAGQSIKTVKELFRDLFLLANNALVFYSRRTREYKSALSLRNLVMKEYKQHCRESCREATSAFLLPFSPPVKPRTARPRPLARPCREWASEKLSGADKVAPPVKEKPCDSETNNVSLNSLLKAKKSVKRPTKVKPELGDTQLKTTPVRQRKRVRK